MGAGARFSPLGILATWAGSTRSAAFSTVALALNIKSVCDYSGWKSVRYLHADVTLGGLAGDQLLPGIGALTNDVQGVPRVAKRLAPDNRTRMETRGNSLLVLALARESELVLGLAVGDLVDTEPLVGGAEETGEVTLHILDVVKLRGQGVVDVDDNDLPVGLTLIEEGHDTEDLDLLDLTGVADELTDFADIERIVVTVGLGLGVDGVGVLPGLGEGTVVPEVTLVGEAVADVAELALLGVLLDRVEVLLLGDLVGH